jgi:hypothetical protein
MISKQVFKKRIDIFFQRIISAVLILPNVISTDQLLIGNTVPVRTRVSGMGGIIDLLDKYGIIYLRLRFNTQYRKLFVATRKTPILFRTTEYFNKIQNKSV